ncbi:MAG TPA: hypothetical protein VGN98_02665 [Tianweitania sediminis]|nr:hypothetical protein [Tianweitania sediminis]
MIAWFESIVGPEYAPAVMWTVIALAVLVLLLIVLRLLRGLSSGTFVMGGRNRKARLAVMDATAVDANRRLVLVRRDDVEHLILIGGPTDVVVEQGIRPLYAPRREEPVATSQRSVSPASGDEAPAAPAPRAERPQAAMASAVPARSAAPAPSATVDTPSRNEPPVSAGPTSRSQAAPPPAATAPLVPPPLEREPARLPARAEPSFQAPSPQVARAASTAQGERAPSVEPHSLDVNIHPPQPGDQRSGARNRDADEVSLEEEMSRLLGNLSPSSGR